MSAQNKKYNKTSFSRNKMFANSEQDIIKNEQRIEDFYTKRSAEREVKLKIASGSGSKNDIGSNSGLKFIDGDDEPVKKIKSVSYITTSKFYFDKMNFIICNLPNRFNIDNVVREFAQWGDIQYITYGAEMKGYKLVVNKWNEDSADIISEIQTNIFTKGKHEWVPGSYIERDPDQSLVELGDKIEYGEDE